MGAREIGEGGREIFANVTQGGAPVAEGFRDEVAMEERLEVSKELGG